MTDFWGLITFICPLDGGRVNYDYSTLPEINIDENSLLRF